MDERRVYRDCLDYLAREEDCLRRLSGAVDALQTAVRGSGWANLPGALDRLEPLLAERDRLGEARKALGDELSQFDGSAAPLEALANRLPAPDAARLRDRKRQLRTLAQDVQRRAQATAFLARHHLAFFDGFFLEITRPLGSAPRYGRAGQLDNSPPGSLLRARG
ncbi:MAG: hypothetical protein U0793_22840 [Gemmataceae bacterium]